MSVPSSASFSQSLVEVKDNLPVMASFKTFSLPSSPRSGPRVTSPVPSPFKSPSLPLSSTGVIVHPAPPPDSFTTKVAGRRPHLRLRHTPHHPPPAPFRAASLFCFGPLQQRPGPSLTSSLLQHHFPECFFPTPAIPYPSTPLLQVKTHPPKPLLLLTTPPHITQAPPTLRAAP